MSQNARFDKDGNKIPYHDITKHFGNSFHLTCGGRYYRPESVQRQIVDLRDTLKRQGIATDKIEEVLGKGEKLIKKPLDKLKDFLKEE